MFLAPEWLDAIQWPALQVALAVMNIRGLKKTNQEASA
jgi:cephalosporin-C deacetylase-like acetyl esterase